MFQFPSNGKAEPKSFHPQPKRRILWFQFPSNGKAEPKGYHEFRKISQFFVSIPFKREGGAKDTENENSWVAIAKVSIPFKREGGAKGGE